VSVYIDETKENDDMATKPNNGTTLLPMFCLQFSVTQIRSAIKEDKSKEIAIYLVFFLEFIDRCVVHG
jgi:hypothetical protein